MRSVGDLWSGVCSNSTGYLECWKPIIEKSKSCNAGTSRGPPSVYKGSLEAICGNDKGVSNAAALTKAANEITTQECSASGDHWQVACKSLESDMSSSDTCTRQRALSNCLDLIICKEQPAGKLLLDLYKTAGTKLGC